jgi:predicted transcriptional regulator
MWWVNAIHNYSCGDAAKTPLGLGLDPQERAALDKAAGAEDRSSAYVARRAVLDWLKANGFLK